MIQANELRIGNWYNEYGVPTKADGRFIDRLQNIQLRGKVAIDVSPIPITAEWLEKMGFSDKDYKPGYIGIDVKIGTMTTDFVLTKPGVMGERQTFYAFIFDNYRFIPIQHLHKLQNLYHALTGQELPIQ